MSHVSYPRLSARTQRFTLGRPRSFTVSPDGRRLVFVRSASGTDRVGRLWTLDTSSGAERELVDPGGLLAGASEQLSAEEEARRERMRESARGIVGYATDREVLSAVFALSGRLFITDLSDGNTRELPAQPPVIDPRLDPTGRWIAYCSQGALRIIAADGTADRPVAEPDGETVEWGIADFIAAEELDRSRGYWWSPSGDQLIVERFDESPVATWFVSDPAHPEHPPVPHRYPAAGTDNASVSLWLVNLDGDHIRIEWDQSEWEYVAAVHWSTRGAPLVQLLERRQQRICVLAIDPATGSSQSIRETSDDCWVDVCGGVPAWGPQGELLTIEVVDDCHALCADGEPITPPHLQVRAVVDVGDNDILIRAQEHPTSEQIWRWSDRGIEPLTPEAGLHAATRGGQTVVTVTADLHSPLTIARFDTPSTKGVVASHATKAPLTPNVTIIPAGADELRVAVVLPTGWHQGQGQLPVLMDPYAGPHFQEVLSAQASFRESQWFADQGFAVVVVDGRGTPGSPSWERAVRGDLASVVLADQVAGLHVAAQAFPDLDLSRVGIRGWSFGGYLAALAVLDRPDVFHAAIVGAPSTHWQLYDTGYTERYLGLPQEQPEAYRRSSLLHRAKTLSRPLQLIHGFADDNVFIAHSLQLSKALTEGGRAHQVLPLTGITHMAAQEEVAENLLLLQVDFLLQALGDAASP